MNVPIAVWGLFTRSAFSLREVQILDLMAEGKTYTEMADELGLSVNTVRSHCKRIYRRMQAANGTHAVALAMSGGLIAPRRPQETE